MLAFARDSGLNQRIVEGGQQHAAAQTATWIYVGGIAAAGVAAYVIVKALKGGR
jgi:hypothetical protein